MKTKKLLSILLIIILFCLFEVIFTSCNEITDKKNQSKTTDSTETESKSTIKDSVLIMKYENKTLGITFDYPNNYKITSKSEFESKAKFIMSENLKLVLFKEDSDYSIYFDLVIESGVTKSNYSKKDYEDYANLLDEYGPKNMYSFKKMYSKIVDVEKRLALDYCLKYDPKLKGWGMTQKRTVSIVKNYKAYHFDFNAPVEFFDKENIEFFEPLIKSIKIN